MYPARYGRYKAADPFVWYDPWLINPADRSGALQGFISAQTRVLNQEESDDGLEGTA